MNQMLLIIYQLILVIVSISIDDRLIKLILLIPITLIPVCVITIGALT